MLEVFCMPSSCLLNFVRWLCFSRYRYPGMPVQRQLGPFDRAKLTADQWHTVFFSVDLRVFSLNVDNSKIPIASSVEWNSADASAMFKKSVLIGGASASLLGRSGFSSGFAGCVSDVNIDSQWLDLTGAAVYHNGVGPCAETGCERLGNRCLNGATCAKLSSGHVCMCPLGYAGADCSQGR